VEKSLNFIFFSLSYREEQDARERFVAELSFFDLFANTGSTFGVDYLIILPLSSLYDYEVTLIKVAFTDGSVWENSSQEPLIAMGAPRSIKSLEKREKLYLEIAPVDARDNLAEEFETWWRCGCGQVNLAKAKPCVRCNTSLDLLLRLKDSNYLHHRSSLKRKKNLIGAAYIACVLVVFAVVLSLLGAVHSVAIRSAEVTGTYRAVDKQVSISTSKTTSLSVSEFVLQKKGVVEVNSILKGKTSIKKADGNYTIKGNNLTMVIYNNPIAATIESRAITIDTGNNDLIVYRKIPYVPDYLNHFLVVFFFALTAVQAFFAYRLADKKAMAGKANTGEFMFHRSFLELGFLALIPGAIFLARLFEDQYGVLVSDA